MEYRNKRVDLEFENNIQYWQLVLFSDDRETVESYEVYATGDWYYGLAKAEYQAELQNRIAMFAGVSTLKEVEQRLATYGMTIVSKTACD